MNLASKLADWQKNSLITAEQRQKILAYENNVRRPMLFYSLLFLSAFCIGIGIIAVISANWEVIPAAVKLLADFGLLILTAWGIWKTRTDEKNVLSESLIILYALLIMASIGLVGQVYHLPSHGLAALLFWSVLTFPLLFLSTKPFFPGIWLLGFGWSLYDRLYEYKWFSRLIDKLFNSDHNYGIWLFLWTMVVLYRLIKQTKISSWQQAWRWWTIALFIAGAVLMDIDNVNILSLNDQVIGWQHWSVAFLLLLLQWLTDRKRVYWPATYALAIMLGCILLTRAFLPLEDAASAVMMVALLGIVSVYAYRTGQNRLFNLVTVLIALRIFGVYLEVFGSLLSTGTGLIISGGVFMGLAVLWQKLRRHWFPALEEKKNV